MEEQIFFNEEWNISKEELEAYMKKDLQEQIKITLEQIRQYNESK